MVHVEIVLEVALIAIARKVIILDLEKYDGVTLIGMAGSSSRSPSRWGAQRQLLLHFAPDSGGVLVYDHSM